MYSARRRRGKRNKKMSKDALVRRGRGGVYEFYLKDSLVYPQENVHDLQTMQWTTCSILRSTCVFEVAGCVGGLAGEKEVNNVNAEENSACPSPPTSDWFLRARLFSRSCGELWLVCGRSMAA